MVGDYINNIGYPVSDSKAKNFIEHSLDENISYVPSNIEPIGDTNKLSLSYKVDDKYIVKVVTMRHLELQRIFSHFWNISIIANSTGRIFGTYRTPKDMVEYEYNTINEMIEYGIKAPEPIFYTEHKKTGIIGIEYIDNFVEYRNIDEGNFVNYTSELYEIVKLMHKFNIAHGDIQSDNILIHNDEVYLIDPTKIILDNREYKRYDLACSIATATTKMDYETSVNLALDYFDKNEVEKSLNYIPSIMLQLGYDFNVENLKNVIDGV